MICNGGRIVSNGHHIDSDRTDNSPPVGWKLKVMFCWFPFLLRLNPKCWLNELKSNVSFDNCNNCRLSAHCWFTCSFFFVNGIINCKWFTAPTPMFVRFLQGAALQLCWFIKPLTTVISPCSTQQLTKLYINIVNLAISFPDHSEIQHMLFPANHRKRGEAHQALLEKRRCRCSATRVVIRGRRGP